MTSDSSNFTLPIRFLLKPSKWLIMLIYLSHLGALFGIYFANIPILLTQLLYLIVLFSLVYWHLQMIYLPRKNPAELLLNDKDEWYVIDNITDEEGGKMISVNLLPESFVHTHLIVLMFQQDEQRKLAILTPDNISETIFRRLRVRLRFSANAG